MRSRTTRTATGKRLMKRVRSIHKSKSSKLTPEQVAYRKRRKATEDYYAHERKLARYNRPR